MPANQYAALQQAMQNVHVQLAQLAQQSAQLAQAVGQLSTLPPEQALVVQQQIMEKMRENAAMGERLQLQKQQLMEQQMEWMKRQQLLLDRQHIESTGLVAVLPGALPGLAGSCGLPGLPMLSGQPQ